MFQRDIPNCLVARSFAAPDASFPRFNLGRLQEKPGCHRSSEVECKGSIRADGDSCGYRSSDVDVCGSRIEFLLSLVIHASPDSRQLSQQPAYLTKVHRLHAFTSQRRANWRAGTGLPGAHDELHHHVLWYSFGGHCCGCPRKNKPETE